MNSYKQFTLNHFRRRIVSTVVLVLLAGFGAAAAKNDKQHSVLGLHIYIPVEHYGIDAGNLNKYMGEAELPQVRVPGLLIGVGTQIQVDRIVVNLSVASSAKQYRPDNARMSAPFSTYGFSVGYDLIRCPFLNLQPYAGLRTARVAYNYEQLSSRSTSTAQTGQSQHEAMKFRGRRGMLDMGIGASFQTKVLAGVRAGVLIPTGRTRWTSDDGAQLSGGPDLSYRYYIGVNLGFGKANIKLATGPCPASAEAEDNVSFVY